MKDWARELLDAMQGLCELLDHGESARPYMAALEQQRAKIDDVERSPSARLLAECAKPGRPFDAWRCACPSSTRILPGLVSPNESRLAEFAAEAKNHTPRKPASRPATSWILIPILLIILQIRPFHRVRPKILCGI